MRVLLVSEGDHELGKGENPGALEIFARRTYGGDLQCDKDKVSNRKVRTHAGKGGRYCKRALAWMRHAEAKGYDALILVIDQDNQSERVQKLTDAQETDDVSFYRALGVAIRTFDAWILADERALSQVLNDTISAQSRPEEIRDAKERCAQLLANSNVALSQSEFYADVAAKVKIETLEERCPKGFVPFAERVRSLSVDFGG